jgi:predicted Zn finger-like uncharacterized protein
MRAVVVQCPSCQTRFRVADEKVSDRGVRVRCSNCKNVFSVKKSGVTETAASSATSGNTIDLSSLDPPMPPPKSGTGPVSTGPAKAQKAPTTGRVSQPASPKPGAKKLDADDLFGMSELTGEADSKPGAAKKGLTLDDLDLGDEPLVPARPKTSPVSGKPKTGPVSGPGSKPNTGPLGLGDLGKPKTGPLGADAGKPKTGPLAADAKPKTGPLGADTKPKTGPLANSARPKTGPLSESKPKTGPLADGSRPKTGPLSADARPKTGPLKDPLDLPELPVAPREKMELSADPFEGLGKEKPASAPTAKPRTDKQDKSDRQEKSDRQAKSGKQYKSIFQERAVPPPSAKREIVSGALTGLVGAALAVVVVIAVSLTDDGAGGWLGLTPKSDVVATRVVSGLYDTVSGKSVFYVRGRVENRGHKAHGPVRVVAELVGDCGVDGKTEALAGAEPSPEEVYSLRSSADAEKLQRALQGVEAERRLLPGKSVPFFAVIADPPPDVQRHRLHLRVEPIDAWTPPRTAEVSK